MKNLIIVIGLIISVTAQGAVNLLVDHKRGMDILNSPVSFVKDPSASLYLGSNASMNLVSSGTTIKFRFDDSKMMAYDENWEMKIVLNVHAKVIDLSTLDSEIAEFTNVELFISYNSVGVYEDADVFYIPNSIEANVEVVDIQEKQGGSSEFISISTLLVNSQEILLSDDFLLETELEIETASARSLSTPFVYFKPISDLSITLAWSYVSGAESYDVEWLYMNSAVSSTNEQLEYDFGNAIRINTTDQYYSIPLHYPEGYILFRVRGVGARVNGLSNESLWSFEPDKGILQIPVSISFPTNVLPLLTWSGAENNFNWQYGLTFSEGGKRGESKNYFDGTFKNRQSIVFDRSKGNAIVSSSAFDLYGRKVIDFLPVATSATGIAFMYAPGNTNASLNGLYGFENYDVYLQPSIPTNADISWENPFPASTSEVGASQFYSPMSLNSADYNSDDYRGDAGGFPFSITQFKNDGSGRPIRIGGPTPALRLNALNSNPLEAHYISIFYSKPKQEELDRLFGSEAGLASHYSKTIQSDANGQKTVSYVDQWGKTVATALTGPVPNNLMKLDLAPPSEIITSDLLSTNALNLNSEKVSTSLVSNSTGVPEVHYFSYTLGDKCYESCCYNPSFLDGNNSSDIILDQDNCMDCKYDLSLSIVDNYGEAISPGSILMGEISVNGQAITIPIWNNPLYFEEISQAEINFEIEVVPGISYTISKVLSINSAQYDLISTDINHNILGDINYAGCMSQNCFNPDYINLEPCTDCEDECFSSFTAFTDPQTNVTTYSNDQVSSLTEEQVLSYCQQQCNMIPAIGICEQKYSALLADMSPGGQYFDNTPSMFLLDSDGAVILIDGTPSINTNYDQNGWLENQPDQATWLVELETLIDNPQLNCCANWDDVRNNWMDDLASSMVVHHPEYRAFEYFCNTYCRDNSVYEFVPLENDYFVLMQTILSEEQARDNDYGINFFNPMGVGLNVDPNAAIYNFDMNSFVNSSNGPEFDNRGYISDEDVYVGNGNLITADYDKALACVRSLLYRDLQSGENYISAFGAEISTFTSEEIIHRLCKFVNLGNDQYYSIWYLMDDPDMIATNPPAGLDQSVVDLFQTMHAAFNNNQTNSSFNKFVFFRSVYSFLRDFFIYRGYQFLIDHPALQTVNGSGTNFQGFKVHYPENPLFEAFAASGYDLSVMGDLVFEDNPDLSTCDGYEGIKSNCDTHQAYWNSYISSCPDLPASITPLIIEEITETMAQLAACGAGGTFPLGTGNDVSGATSLMFANCEPCLTLSASYYSFQDIFDDYEIPCVAPCFPDNKGPVLCAWEHFMDYLSSRWITLPNGTETNLLSLWQIEDFLSVVETLNVDYGEVWIDGTPVITTITQSNIDEWYLNYTNALTSSCEQILPDPSTWSNFPFECITYTEDDVFNDQDPTEECNQSILALNDYNSMLELIEYISSLQYEYLSEFNSYCLNSYESFTEQYELNEYYYTLYYYDQAGNLTKTVPPSGVTPLIITDSNDSPNDYDDISDVAELRLSGQQNAYTGDFIWPNHKMITNYKYNSHNQITEQTTPDGGTSKMWYDRLDRLILSQNERQRGEISINDDKYTYSLYDALSRPVETGEISAGEAGEMTWSISRDIDDDNPETPLLEEWMAICLPTKTEITTTVYDESLNENVYHYFGENGQKNLRNRISSMLYKKINYPNGYNSAIHYSYDIHGNVATVITENNQLKPFSDGILRTDYKYDLISGSVLDVQYQKLSDEQGLTRADYSAHKYFYDQQNRITEVLTSVNPLSSKQSEKAKWTFNPGIWERDARYEYYNLGALARTEIGDKQVQGLDYAYNIQGWLLGVNSWNGSPVNDIGRDGTNYSLPQGALSNPITPLHAVFSQDAFGYTLHYYENDYSPVNAQTTAFRETPTGFLGAQNPDVEDNCANLFNGNISAMISTVLSYQDNNTPGNTNDDFNALTPLGRTYRYDQSNRIKRSTAYIDNFGSSSAATPTEKYKETFTFDMNGNITALMRNGSDNGTSNPSSIYDLDDLRYYYYREDGSVYDASLGASDPTNKLAYVVDVSGLGQSVFTDDIDTQMPENYLYDGIGNLIHDEAEEIDIEWNLQGKITRVVPFDNGNDPELYFEYDPLGNRVSKTVKPRVNGVLLNESEWLVTYYSVDANGEVMAVYEDEYVEKPGLTNGWYHRLYVTEKHIYGSSRIGMQQSRTLVEERIFTSAGFNEDGKFTSKNYLNSSEVPTTPPIFALMVITPNNEVDEKAFSEQHVVGKKRYELTNHLGNVLTVISDKRIAVDEHGYTASPSGNYSEAPGVLHLFHSFVQGTAYAQNSIPDGFADYYIAEIISSSEYSAYGVPLNDWGYQSEGYRYGFQNQEHDNELWSGAVSYKYRVEDPRLGRFFSVDPLAAKYPHNSAYAFSENRLMDAVELEGLEATLVKEEYGWDIPGVGRHDRSQTVISLKADVTSTATAMSDATLFEVVKQAKAILIAQIKIDDIFNSVELNADGVNTNTSNATWDVTFVDEVYWKGKKTKPGTLGATEEIGQTSKNTFEILYRGDSPEDITNMARTLAHELGHGLGLEHPDWADAMLLPDGRRCFTCHPASVSSRDSEENLMRQSKHTSGIVIEEVQIKEVIQEITNDGGATIYTW